MIMKKLIFFLHTLLVATAMMAVPARPGVIKVTQKDGTVLSVRLVGDEHFSYYVNEADGQKMYRAADGDLLPLDAQSIRLMMLDGAERRASAEKARANRLNSRRMAGGARTVGDVGDGMIGEKRGIVILANFKDVKFTKTQQDFYNQFNQEGYNQNNHMGSVKDYFHDQSYGLFNLEFDVVGPVELSQNMAYYGEKYNGKNDHRPATMVREACVLAKDLVDFSDYDWNDNGSVDQVFVIYAGYGEAQGASSNTVWPHEWNLSSAAYYGDGQGRLYQDGVYIDTYACSCELSGYSGAMMDGIGTACHEFSHCLGYPDLYDTDYSGGWGMDHWDLMCSGSYNGYNGRGECPSGYTSYERWLAGWLEPVELAKGKNVTGMKPLNDSPEAYIIYNNKNRNEFIMLENRKNDKWFKYMTNRSNTSARGLLAIHVDYNASIWSQNRPNDDPNHQRVTIIPAGGAYDSKYSAHPFPGSRNVTKLTATSHSSVGGKWWTACSTGSKDLNHELKKIAYDSADNTVSFQFDGGDAIDDGTRYKVTLNVGSGTCDFTEWTQTKWQEMFELPTAVGSREDYEFLGWSLTDVAKTTEEPEELIDPGTMFELESDTAFYAVYRYRHTPLGNYFEYSTVISVDKNYVILSSQEAGLAYAVDKDSVENNRKKGSPVQVKMVGDTPRITGRISPSAVWNCNHALATNRRLVNDGDYLKITDDGLATTTTATNISWKKENGLYGNAGLSRYYTHATAEGEFYTDTKSGNPVYVFEEQGEASATYYATTYNYYTLTYNLAGELYQQGYVEAGTTILPLDAPEAPEGYSFSGWEGLPEVMPAEDIVVDGSFTINSYKVLYYVGDSLVHVRGAKRNVVMECESLKSVKALETKELGGVEAWRG